MKKSTRTKLTAALAELDSTDDFNEASGLYNAAANAFQRRAKSQFAVGDTVTFKDRDGHRVNGTVTAINKKNVKVMELEPRRMWNVAPSLLSLVK